MKAITFLLAVFCVLLSSAAQLAMKRGMAAPPGADLGTTYLHALSSPFVWLGVVLFGGSAVLWLWVLSRLDVSLAYPLVSLGFVVTFALGVWWLGEPFSWLRLAGCALIVAGVVVMAWS